MLTALAPSPYAGPPLRGADNAFVECKSAASFTVHFDLSALLPCLDRRVMVVRSAPAAVQEVSADGSLYVRIRRYTAGNKGRYAQRDFQKYHKY